ncbi:MAG: dockerin type I repeat-containing protein [Muribaculaceae bacterium]|nr:dockerin type I repeat-containing protein [Muribaculaceae bacterium]
MSAGVASADNYFTIGENDTLRINPIFLGSNYPVSLRAHFEGRLDIWFLNLYLPSGLTAQDFDEGDDMTVSYINSDSLLATYDANLFLGYVEGGYGLSTYINATGYWDYNFDHMLEPYGYVKWEPGDYPDMVRLSLNVSSTFTGGTATVSGSLTSTNDTRGGTINSPNTPVPFTKTVTVYVGYKRGDVNGDDLINISDVNALTNYLINDEALDAYQLAAADWNGDGEVNITDALLLTSYILNLNS